MIMNGWQTANYIDNIICKHETEFCRNHIHCETCSYYKNGNLTTKKHKTNADKIRSMTDEELAKLMDEATDYFNCDECEFRHLDDCGMSHLCQKHILKWLKSEVW